MFLRLVTHIIRAEETEKNAEVYARSVLTALRTTRGCVFASLLQNTGNPQECISLTIWNSRKESTDYEESGLYEKLVDSLRPFFAASSEWKLELSEDLSLEYTPVKIEPTVAGFDESVAGAKKHQHSESEAVRCQHPHALCSAGSERRLRIHFLIRNHPR